MGQPPDDRAIREMKDTVFRVPTIEFATIPALEAAGSTDAIGPKAYDRGPDPRRASRAKDVQKVVSASRPKPPSESDPHMVLVPMIRAITQEGKRLVGESRTKSTGDSTLPTKTCRRENDRRGQVMENRVNLPVSRVEMD